MQHVVCFIAYNLWYKINLVICYTLQYNILGSIRGDGARGGGKRAAFPTQPPVPYCSISSYWPFFFPSHTPFAIIQT